MLQCFVVLCEAIWELGAFLWLTTPIAPPPYMRWPWKVNWFIISPCCTFPPSFITIGPVIFHYPAYKQTQTNKRCQKQFLSWRNEKKLGPLFHRHLVDSYWGHTELPKNAVCRLLLKNAYRVTEFTDLTIVLKQQEYNLNSNKRAKKKALSFMRTSLIPSVFSDELALRLQKMNRLRGSDRLNRSSRIGVKVSHKMIQCNVTTRPGISSFFRAQKSSARAPRLLNEKMISSPQK